MENSRGRNYVDYVPLSAPGPFSRFSQWGKALFISSSRRPSRDAPLSASGNERTDPLRAFLSFSLVVPRESAAILYIAKSFTISLGTFIIP